MGLRGLDSDGSGLSPRRAAFTSRGVRSGCSGSGAGGCSSTFMLGVVVKLVGFCDGFVMGLMVGLTFPASRKPLREPSFLTTSAPAVVAVVVSVASVAFVVVDVNELIVLDALLDDEVDDLVDGIDELVVFPNFFDHADENNHGLGALGILPSSGAPSSKQSPSCSSHRHPLHFMNFTLGFSFLLACLASFSSCAISDCFS